MIYLVLGYLVINPLFFMYGVDLRPAQELCFQISSITLIIAGMFFDNNKVKRSKLNLWIGIGALWVLAVWQIHSMGWSVMFNTLLGTGVYFTVIRTVKKDDFKLIARTIAWVGAFTLGYLALQYFGYDLRDQAVLNAPGLVPKCSVFGLKAAMGEYFALVIPFLLSFSWISLLLIIPVALSYSCVAMLAGTTAIMFFCWFRKRIVFWALIPVILVMGLVYWFKFEHHSMMGSRIPMWGMVIQDSWKQPFGRGLDSFRNDTKMGSTKYFKHDYDHETIRAIYTEQGWAVEKQVDAKFLERAKLDNPLDFWDHPHNEYIWLFYELGLPGLFILGFIVYHLIQRFKYSRRDTATVALAAGVIVFFISCIGQFPLHMARLGHIVPILFGFYYLQTEEDV